MGKMKQLLDNEGHTTMTLMDKACYERGCICYDSQDQNEFVEVVAKTDDQRELDMTLANTEEENRYLKAHISKLMGEVQMLTDMMRHMSDRVRELEGDGHGADT